MSTEEKKDLILNLIAEIYEFSNSSGANIYDVRQRIIEIAEEKGVDRSEVCRRAKQIQLKNITA